MQGIINSAKNMAVDAVKHTSKLDWHICHKHGTTAAYPGFAISCAKWEKFTNGPHVKRAQIFVYVEGGSSFKTDIREANSWKALNQILTEEINKGLSNHHLQKVDSVPL